jgi:hypothetical protein
MVVRLGVWSPLIMHEPPERVTRRPSIPKSPYLNCVFAALLRYLNWTFQKTHASHVSIGPLVSV